MGEGNDEGPSRRHGRTRLRLQIVVSWCGLLFWVLVLGSCCLGRLISCVVLVWGFFGYVFRFVIGSCYRLRVFFWPEGFCCGVWFRSLCSVFRFGFLFSGSVCSGPWAQFWTNVGSILDQLWASLGSIWNRFGANWGPIWSQIGGGVDPCGDLIP